jgi:hypothetical protein
MRCVLLALLPLLAACAAETVPLPADALLVADDPLSGIDVSGEGGAFTLRPGLTLPPAEEVVWNGQVFSFRWLEGGGELPYPPPPPLPDMPAGFVDELIYPSIALVGGTEDPRAAFVVSEIRCGGGAEAAMSYSISMPPRYTPTGEWVFEQSRRCDD